jgi:glycosyltransferase involved in cell wall biosynthesis
MNILHFSTLNRGGAAQAAYRFHKHLHESGVRSIFCVNIKEIDDDSILEVNSFKYDYHKNILFQRIEDRLGVYDPKYCYYDRGRYSIQKSEKIISQLQGLDFVPDAIVLHWISKFVDLKVIRDLQKQYNVPVFWYMMDMAPFTGGCHFAWECPGYMSDCTDCPATRAFYVRGKSRRLLGRKKRLSEEMGMEILSPATWLSEQAKRSSLYGAHPVHLLPLGINADVFRPKDKRTMRKRFGLPLDKKIVFFGTSNIDDQRKGYAYLREALRFLERHYSGSGCIIVTAGNAKNAESLFSGISLDHYHIGYLAGDEALSDGYGIADVFVSPSIEDSGPMMVNEALLCGIPVVSFDIGIALDVVIDDVTGFRVPIRESEKLAYGIMKVLNLSDDKYEQMAADCRRVSENFFSVQSQIDSFKSIVKNTAYSNTK